MPRRKPPTAAEVLARLEARLGHTLNGEYREVVAALLTELLGGQPADDEEA